MSNTDGQPLFQNNFMSLLDRLPEGVTVTDTGGVILYVNPFAAEHMYGLPADRVVGQLIQSFLVPDQREPAEQRLRELRELPVSNMSLPNAGQGPDPATRWTFQRSDGTVIELEGRTRKVKSANQLLFVGAFHLSLASRVAETTEGLEIAQIQLSALIDEQAAMRRLVDELVTHVAFTNGELESLWGELGRHADIIDATATVAKQIKATSETDSDDQPEIS